MGFRWELVTDVGTEEAELGDWVLQVCGHDQGISALQLDCQHSGRLPAGLQTL